MRYSMLSSNEKIVGINFKKHLKGTDREVKLRIAFDDRICCEPKWCSTFHSTSREPGFITVTFLMKI